MLTQPHQEQVDALRNWIERLFISDARFSECTRHDRRDGSTLVTRWRTKENPNVYIEFSIRPFIPQLRVAIVTDDRWKSEDFEEKIQESGDTMSEFVELGFEDAGLDWEDPIVEHYREEGKYFCFATPFEIDSLDSLADDVVRSKIARMMNGYHHAFAPYLAE